MDNSIFGGFVECGCDGLQHLGRIILLPGIEQAHEASFQTV